MIRVKRVYEAPAEGDGARYLVDRLWPRGVKKEALKLDGWLKDVAPSDKLRNWFGHDPKKWNAFQRKYAAELDAQPHAWMPSLMAARRGKITLLFSAKDTVHNNAVALQRYLQEQQTSRRK